MATKVVESRETMTASFTKARALKSEIIPKNSVQE